MNLHYAHDIILLTTSEVELQDLVDHLDQVSRKHSLIINVDKTKIMAAHCGAYGTHSECSHTLGP